MGPSGWNFGIQRAGPPEHYHVTSGGQPVPLLTPQLPGHRCSWQFTQLRPKEPGGTW